MEDFNSLETIFEKDAEEVETRKWRTKSDTDYSDFVSDIKVNHEVELELSENCRIKCCGVFLAHSSAHLRALLQEQTIIKMRGFDETSEDGLRDCLRLMYGGSITINFNNFRDILKFSVYFSVNFLYRICSDWVSQQKDIKVVLDVVKFILSNERIKIVEANVPPPPNSICWVADKFSNNSMLLRCREVLTESKAQLAGQLGTADLEPNLVFFLFGFDTVDELCGVFGEWVREVDSDKRCEVMLDCIDDMFRRASTDRDSKIAVHAEAINRIFTVVIEVNKSPESAGKLSKLENIMMRCIMSQVVKVIDFTPREWLDFLEYKRWRASTLSQLIKFKSRYSISYSNFAEISLDWITTSSPSYSTVNDLCREIDFDMVPCNLFQAFRSKIKERYPEIQAIRNKEAFEYRYFTSSATPTLREQLLICNTVSLSVMSRVIKFRLIKDRDVNEGVHYEITYPDGTPLKASSYILCKQRIPGNKVINIPFFTKTSNEYLSLLTNSFARIKEKINTSVDFSIYIVREKNLME